MLGAKPSESGESVTLGNRTGALVIGVLVLLGHAGDQRPPTPRPTDDVLGKGTVSIPVATKEPEPPPSAEPMPGRESPKPPVSAPPAKSPDSRKSGMPPGRAVAGALAQKESRHVPADRPPKPAAPAESALPADTAPRTENAPVTKTVPRTATAPPTEAPAPAESPTLATTLDLGSLEKRLRETTAIGVFTKLSLKNQVDDLLDEFREFHKRHDPSMLTRLRQAYDLLLLKVLSLLQDRDPGLARDIASSREALWSILTDPDKFKEL